MLNYHSLDATFDSANSRNVPLVLLKKSKAKLRLMSLSWLSNFGRRKIEGENSKDPGSPGVKKLKVAWLERRHLQIIKFTLSAKFYTIELPRLSLLKTANTYTCIVDTFRYR